LNTQSEKTESVADASPTKAQRLITPVTLSGTARDALRAAVRQLEEQYNDGDPFPDRDSELKGGNPNLK
jgi:hypothetical protein